MAMHSAVMLASQNERLTAENQRQKRKKAKRRMYIAKGGILIGAEAQVLIDNNENSRTDAVQDRQGEARQCAPPRCSLCGSLEHKAPICPRYQRID
jgi:hypothetical protein